MAVTLEGVFKIFDRASPAIAKIERNAKSADRAINKLGRSLDKLAARQEIAKVDNLGDSIGKLTNTTNAVDRAMGKASRTSRGLNDNMNRNGTTTRRLTSDMGRFEQVMRKVVVISTGLMKVLAPVKLLAIGAAIRPIIGGISALAAGAVGLVQQLVTAAGAAVPLIARMGDLAGAGAAVVTVMLSVKAATLTTKFAMDGVKQAIGGSADAMKKLTPEARAFVREMQKLQPVMNTIRGSAQRGLFPGLTGAIKTARSNGAFQAANQAAGGIGSAVGGVAQAAATRFSDPSVLKDMVQQSRTFAFVISGLGRAGIDLVDVFRKILFAAQPLTRWLVTAVQGWAHYLNVQTQIARDSGGLGRYFANTRRVLTNLGHTVRDFGAGFLTIMRVARGESTQFGSGIAQIAKSFRDWTSDFSNQARIAQWFQRAQVSARMFGRILLNVWNMAVGIGKAASGLGGSLTGGIEKATRRWAEWVNSFRGQNELKKWFDGMKGTLDSMWHLISDISGAFVRLGAGGGGATSLLESLRSLVPDLERALNAFSQNIGPGLFGTLREIVHLLATLTSAGSSPLGMLLNATAGILTNVNAVLDRFKAVRVAAGAAIAVIGGALLLRKLAQIAGSVGTIAAMWGRVTGATVAATEAAGAYGAVAGVAGSAGARGGGVGGGVPIGLGLGQRMPKTVTAPTGFFGKLGGKLGGARIGGMGGMMGMGIGIGAPIAVGLGAQLAQSQGWIGQRRASQATNVATMAGTGAMIGSFFPGAGTLIGAGVGAGLGLGINALTGPGDPSPQQKYLESLARTAKHSGGFDITQDQGGAQTLAGAEKYQSVLDRSRERLLASRTTAIAAAPKYQPTRWGAGKALNPQDNGAVKAINAQLKANQALRLANIGRLGQERAAARALREQTEEMRKQAHIRQSKGIAAGLLTSYGHAYNEYRKAGQTPKQATHNVVTGALSRGKTIKTAEGRKIFYSGIHEWLDENRKLHPELKKEEDRFDKGMKKAMGDVHKTVVTSGKKVLEVSKPAWQAISKSITDPAEHARQVTHTAFTGLQNDLKAMLLGMGYSGSIANSLVMQLEQGGTAGAQAQSTVNALMPGTNAGKGPDKGKARGGRIGGYGLKDTVPIAPGTMAAPGELIVNRHTESKADKLLRMAGGPSLGSLVGGETRRHDQDIMPDAGIFMAKGGRLGRAIREANRIDSMHIPYSWGGSHGTPSNPNGPWDCSSATSRVLQAAGYGNPTMVSGGFMNWGLPGPGPIGIAANKGHVYMVLNGKAWGTSRSNPGGGPGWISGGYRPGFVQRHAPGAGGAGMPFGMAGGLPMVGPLNYSAFAQGLAGAPAAISLRGGHALANVMRQRVNSKISKLGGMSQGGRVDWGGWHAKGSDRTYNKPTLLGVGESGSERVTVTPAGGGSGGALVNVESIVIHGGGDPKKVRRELDLAFADLARQIKSAPAVGGA